MLQKSWKVIVTVMLALLINGCTLSQSHIKLQSDKAVVLNPTDTNKKVMINKIVDKRKFEAKPKNPATPSLARAKYLNTKSVTSRTVGRKRGGFGNAGGNIALPKNTTVETVVRRIVEDSFKKRGYQVVQSQGKGVKLVNVDINKFWFWVTPGFWAIALEADTDLTLSTKSSILIKNPVRVKGYTKLHTQMGVDRKYANTLKKALAQLESSVEKVIK